MPRQDKINVALTRIVESIVPVLPGDDEAAIEERLDQAFDDAYAIIDAYVMPRPLNRLHY